MAKWKMYGGLGIDICHVFVVKDSVTAYADRAIENCTLEYKM